MQWVRLAEYRPGATLCASEYRPGATLRASPTTVSRIHRVGFLVRLGHTFIANNHQPTFLVAAQRFLLVIPAKGLERLDLYSWRALVLQIVGFVIERHLEEGELGFDLRKGEDDPIHHPSTFNLPPDKIC